MKITMDDMTQQYDGYDPKSFVDNPVWFAYYTLLDWQEGTWDDRAEMQRRTERCLSLLEPLVKQLEADDYARLVKQQQGE